MAPIALGSVAKDKITGLVGVVVCRSEWLNGCVRVSLQPRELHDGKPLDLQTFDEVQLEVLDESAAGQAKPSGGPRPEPKRQSAPR